MREGEKGAKEEMKTVCLSRRDATHTHHSRVVRAWAQAPDGLALNPGSVAGLVSLGAVTKHPTGGLQQQVHPITVLEARSVRPRCQQLGSFRGP